MINVFLDKCSRNFEASNFLSVKLRRTWDSCVLCTSH